MLELRDILFLFSFLCRLTIGHHHACFDNHGSRHAFPDGVFRFVLSTWHMFNHVQPLLGMIESTILFQVGNHQADSTCVQLMALRGTEHPSLRTEGRRKRFEVITGWDQGCLGMVIGEAHANASNDGGAKNIEQLAGVVAAVDVDISERFSSSSSFFGHPFWIYAL